MLENLIGVVLDNKYFIEKKLGQGGMGAVYLATHLGTDRPVALKVIAPQFMSNQEFVERFKREAKAAGRLRHVNVVNVTDFGFAKISQGDVAYLVMEYLSGYSLADFLRQKVKQQIKLPLSFVVDIIEQICLAINEAHKQGIIHRDLKPDNIWLEPNGRGGYNVKVLDFGLAKLYEQTSITPNKKTEDLSQNFQNNSTTEQVTAITINQENTIHQITQAQPQLPSEFTEAQTNIQPTPSLAKDNNLLKTPLTKSQNALSEYQTQSGAILGTPLYMSPEQCLGKQLNFASDIYALGIITYEMLSGERPFSGNSADLIKQHIEIKPTQLEKKRKDIPKAVSRLIMSTLAKNPTDRPESIMAFAIILRTNAEGEQPLMEEAKKIYTKHRWLFIKLAVFPHTFTIALTVLVALLHKWGFIIILPGILFANSLSMATASLVLKKLRLDPSNPIKLIELLKEFINIIPKLSLTSLQNLLECFLGLLRFIVGGIKIYLGNSLHPLITVLELKNSKLALERSKVLTNRLPSISKKLQFCDLFVAVLICAPLFGLMWVEFWSENKNFTYTDINLGEDSIPFLIIIYATFWVTLLILDTVYQTNAIAQNLLYLKSCQISNEPFAENLEILTELSGNKTPQASFWQSLKTFFAPLAKMLLGVVLGSLLSLFSIVLLTLVGVPIEGVDRDSSPLLDSAKQGNNTQIKALISSGTNVNEKDANSKSALMFAAEEGRVETAKLLIELGCNINEKDRFGKTSLIYAAAEGRIEIIKLLLLAGADLNTKDKSGRTALFYAKNSGYLDVVQLLEASSTTE